MVSASHDTEPVEPSGPPASAEELRLVAALRAGDEAAFAVLVDRYHLSLLRLARHFVSTAESAEEVVQETWLGVLQGIGRFEGRSSLKTWIYRILTNRAKTRGEREARTLPFASAFASAADDDEPAVEPERFFGGDHRFAGHWTSAPRGFSEQPEERLLATETASVVRTAIDALAPNQREVITLRDVQGWSAEEVCNALAISETNQRVLLHRARAKVRKALEAYLSVEEAAGRGDD